MECRVAFAANREIGHRALRALLDRGVEPVALLVADEGLADGAEAMRARVPEAVVLRSAELRTDAGVDTLRATRPDYLLSIHYPHLLSEAVLAVPRVGALNLHPAYLPYNRGWHTASWALLDGTPFGATLHWMDEGLDTGDIALRERIEPEPTDTAHTLYGKAFELEMELFERAIPLMLEDALPRTPQEPGATMHRRKELGADAVRRIDLDEKVETGALLRRLRALTTNRWAEAAYMEVDGRRYGVRVELKEL